MNEINFEECGICYSAFAEHTVFPCMHKYCENCLVDVYRKFHYKCAFCRQNIFGTNESEKYQNILVLEVGNGKHAGVTLHNSPKGCVKVKKLNRKDQAYGLLKKGDIIKEINGLPALHHKQVVDIINYWTTNNKFVYIQLKQ